MTLQTFKLNRRGRDFAVGDLHGAFSLLERALERVAFDPKADRVFSAGDLVNGGPESERCAEFLSKAWFHAVRGNHDQTVLDVIDVDGVLLAKPYHKFRGYGYQWLESLSKKKRSRIRELIEDMPLAMQIKTKGGYVGVVHGEVPLAMDWASCRRALEEKDDRVIESLLYGRKRIHGNNQDGVGGITRIFQGHSPGALPVRLGNCIMIDTSAVKRLTKNCQDAALTIAELNAPDEAFDVPYDAADPVNYVHG